MADRYWVGGTANWDGTAGTKWSATDGGPGGASVPTSADAVFFTASSGAGTVTIATGNTGALSINCTGFAGTLAGSASITVAGSITLAAGMTYTYTGQLTITGTGTITSAAKSFNGSVIIDGVGITVTLGDAWTLGGGSGTLTLTRGTLTTNNYNLTALDFNSANTNTRTLNLGSSTVTLTFNGWNTSTNTNFTLNAGTSTVIIANTGGGNLQAGPTNDSTAPGLTFYNVSFVGFTFGGIRGINGKNTFNNLTLAGSVFAGFVAYNLTASQTINGTFSTTSVAGNRRVICRTNSLGIAHTLTVNASPSLTDIDFRDIYVIGTAAPISGTRIGDLRGCRGITFSTPKTVYWSNSSGGNWSSTSWATSAGGVANDANFPLAQDTATFVNTGLNTSATVTMDTALPYTGTVDMSGRTNAMTLSVGAYTIYGDWKNGSGTTLSGANTLTYSGRNTQTITSAGRTFSGPLTVDSYGGSVELADALNIGTNSLTVTNGTFDTKNFNVTAGALSSNNTNVRGITLGSSTLTFSGTAPVQFAVSLNLTFSAGTSQINLTSASAITFDGGFSTFYNVSFTGTTAVTHNITGQNAFNNLTLTAPAATGLMQCTFGLNQTITGALTVSGATPVRRIFIRSNTFGTQRTLSVGTLSATDCDLRDIAITGAAAGSSPTRAGDCGGNSGITFPAGKTVYWNLAGAQNWSATGWASSSGGTPDINNFPLAQDTAVFDNTGSVTGTITIDQAWNIGTFDASARTSAMTLTNNASCLVYGDWKFGTGVTSSSTATTITFAKRGTQTITSNGVAFGTFLAIWSLSGTTQLADALSTGSSRTLTLTYGTFNAGIYNVTVGTFDSVDGTAVRTLRMGTGTWTLSSTGNVWNISATNLIFYKGSANIVLSDTSTSSRTFEGVGFSYNKLTIGGATGVSILTINGNNQFTELASTKTVAHTITLGTTTQTFGKWTVTGTAGNVVTLSGTGTSHILAGACTSGIDYLAMGSIGFAATSPGEFYAGANSTGTAGAPVYRTAKPADSTRYWVGGTGLWSNTARWSTSSGGASGASVPRSHDDVVFDAASSGLGYTATMDTVAGGLRMKSLTISAPGAGNLTLAGTGLTFVHNNISFPASGFICTYSGTMTLTGSTTGRTLTTNGIAHSFSLVVNGVDCGWSFGSAATPSGIIVTNGSLDFAGYAVTTASLATNNANSCTVNFGSGTTTISGTNPINFGTTENTRASLTVTASTSQINVSSNSPTFSGNNQTFYNVSFTGVSTGTITINGANSYNNLSFSGSIATGLKFISLAANQTVAGTLTFPAGTDATMRRFCRSDTIGTTRTITAAAVSMTDVDFRDITIAGAAAPASGTRIGDCKGNSGITFTAATTRYWNLVGGGSWSSTGWAATAGGAPAANNFPLAQDTAVFQATGLNSGATVTIDQGWNIGTIDMSARTTNTMTLATGTTTPFIHGNWINGTGTTVTGTSIQTFAGRATQTITSAGKNMPFALYVDSPGGTVVLQDAYSSSTSGSDVVTVTRGTFDAATYNVTLSGAAAGVSSNNSNVRTIAVGSGTWTIAGTSPWSASTSTNLTVTGTGTISLTSASAKTFAGGSVSYSGITLNQGGNGTLTITGDNTFKTISSTAAGANTISLGTTTQTVTTSWTAAGTAGNVLTVTGSSATSPGTLVFTGSGRAANVDYLAITGVRAYSLTDTWYAGGNSTNNGSLGWIFAAAGGTIYNVSFSDTAIGADAISATATFNVSFSDTATGLDVVSTGSTFSADFSDSATGTDAIAASVVVSVAFSDTATGADALNTSAVLNVAISDTATGTDTLNTTATLNVAFSDTATGADAINVNATLSAAFSDTATGADAVATTATLNVSVSDTASGLDAVSAGLVFSAAFADTASGADSINAGGAFNVAFSDTASGADAISATATLIAAFSDAASILDDPAVAASIFNVSLNEVASGLDILSPAGSTFNVSLSESGTLVDLVAGDYLWNPIDDSQSPNWQNVVATQAPGWTDVNTTQSPGWQNVVTAPTTTWTDIDDSQSPGWVQIQT